MIERNYTIPINEEFEKYEGCPVCRLHGKLETQNLEYILGAAMMEPDVRIETNRTGFCSRHYSDMLSAKSRLSLALILETHLKEIENLMTLTPKTGKKELRSSVEQLVRMSESCFLCDRISSTFRKYCDNIVYLWKSEPVFREKFQKQPIICFRHTADLLKSAGKHLNDKQLAAFAADLFRVTSNGLAKYSDEISRFCKSFDYRFTNIELGEAKHACEHAIDYLTGIIKNTDV
jgi:hypothetical protein